MKLNKILTSVAVMLITSTAAIAQEAPFQADILTRNGTKYIKITALDDVNIWKVKLNRGNCEVKYPYYAYGKFASDNLEALKAGKQVKDTSLLIHMNYRLKGTKFESSSSDDYWSKDEDYHMKFGEVKEFRTNCESILELELTTDEKVWKFTRNKQ